MASVGNKIAAGAGKAATPLRVPPRAGRDSAAGRLLRAGFDKDGKPQEVAVRLFPNPDGERYRSEQFAPVRALKPGVLKPGNRYGPLATTNEDDGDEEAAAAAAAAGGEDEAPAAGDDGGDEE